IVEVKVDSPLSPQGLPQQFRPYHPKITLSGYQYPTMALLPDSLLPLLQKVQSAHNKMRRLLGNDDNLRAQDFYHHYKFIYNQIIALRYVSCRRVETGRVV